MMKLSLLGSGLLLTALLLNGCGPSAAPDKAGESVFRYGTTAYGVAMENAGMDPHESYKGWSTLRYGVGETLFRFNEAMQPQPWLATGYEFLDDHTVKITLRDDVNFSSGARLTGAAVKACLEDLVKRHKRAADDLKLASITADGQTVTIKSQEKAPALINYLCDPYGCIIDMQRGTADDVKISGTGPYIVQSLTPTEIVLTKNPAYWGGRVKTDKVIVRSIPDGDTLTMALQNGEIDYCGQTISKMEAHKIIRLGLAQVPEGRRVFSGLTVQQNLQMGAYTRRDGKEAIQNDFDMVFDLLPRLKERRNQPAGTLSGGEQQMLAMGRALMCKPKMLLLDEPSMGLSPLLVKEIFKIIRQVNRNGVTVLLVEQNAKMALEIANRAYVLETGTIKMEGEATELANNIEVRKAYLGCE